MSSETTRFSAVHPPCGTLVETDLPPGYPVQEGVGLWCQVCEQAFWHEPGATQAPTFLPPQAPEPAPLAGALAAGEKVAVEREEAQRRAEKRAAVEAVAEGGRHSSLRLAGVVVIALILGLAVLAAKLLGGSDGAPVNSEVPAVTPTPTATATLSPAPAPAGLSVGGRQVTLDEPPGWITRVAETGGVTRQTPRGSGRVSVSARALRGRSLARLGRDARTNLRRELRRHRISGPTPIDLNGRRALRVTARRGADAHELTVVAVGDQRFVVVLDLSRTAPRQVRSTGRTVADSVVIT